MNILDVKLVHYPEIKPGTLEDGLPVASRPDIYAFSVKTDEAGEKDEVIVPNDRLNGHYREVAEWYNAQEKKPFEFEFHDFETSDNSENSKT